MSMPFARSPARLAPALLLLLAAPLLIWPEWNRQLFLALHPALQIVPAPFWRLCSVFGDWPTVLALLLAACWRAPRRLPALIVGCSLAIALAIVLKAGFGVERPPLALPANAVRLLDALPGNGSFPSGHAMAAATLAAFLARGLGWRCRAGLAAGVILVMLSRIAIGVHWPADLLVGGALGWSAMALALWKAWPQGWPQDITRTVLIILLTMLAGSLVWMLSHPGVYAEYWLRVAIAALVLLWSGVRLFRAH